MLSVIRIANRAGDVKILLIASALISLVQATFCYAGQRSAITPPTELCCIADPTSPSHAYLFAANIPAVWKTYTGKGVRIALLEPSAIDNQVLNYNNINLRDNIDSRWLIERASVEQKNSGVQGQGNDHATAVATIMVGLPTHQNETIGVASRAKVSGYWISKSNLSGLARMQEYDIVNNSWSGVGSNFGLAFLPTTIGDMPKAFIDAIKKGRGGLGTVIVTCAGNGRLNGDNANYSSVSNTRSSIIVGALPVAQNTKNNTKKSQQESLPFSNPGASVLVSAPAVYSLTTATSKTEIIGTSFAAPIVTGIAALMLEANPRLGYRDVQEILAVSAKDVPEPMTVWQNNGSRTWNGGGMHVSHDYGYGEVDARAAVALAETWPVQHTWLNAFSLPLPISSKVLETDIPDGDLNGISNTVIFPNLALSVEHVEVRVKLTHTHPGDLMIKLISPSGTQSVLMNRPGKNPYDPTARGDKGFMESQTLDYVFSTALLRGESATGRWTLQVIDAVKGDTGKLHSWSMNAFGAPRDKYTHYIYTDEFPKLAQYAGRNVLRLANSEAATLNAAAMSSGSRIDLRTGNATLAGTTLTIINPERMRKLIGGEFDDTLIGNSDNTLLGGRGDDVLIAGAGNNILIGGPGNDSFFILPHANTTTTIADFEVGIDKMVLMNFKASLTEPLKIRQEGADTRVELENDQSVLLKNIAGLTLNVKDILIVRQLGLH